MAGMFVGICPQNRNGSLCTKAGGPLPEQWTCTGSLEKVRGGEGLRAGVSERTQDEWLVSQWCTCLAQTHHDFSHSRSQVHSWTLYTTLRVSENIQDFEAPESTSSLALLLKFKVLFLHFEHILGQSRKIQKPIFKTSWTRNLAFYSAVSLATFLIVFVTYTLTGLLNQIIFPLWCGCLRRASFITTA